MPAKFPSSNAGLPCEQHSFVCPRQQESESELQEGFAFLGCVMLNGKQYEPDSLKPLLEDTFGNHPELDIHMANADGIFNSQPYRETVWEILGEDATLNTAVNPRRK